MSRTDDLLIERLLEENGELKAELTKARELWATEQAIKEQPGEDVLWQVLDAAVGVLTRRAAPHAWESEAFEAGRKIIMARREGLTATAPNQSAPADKGQGEPVAVVMPFDFEHPLSKERRTVTLTKRDVFDGMEDYFYEKLSEQICQCESVGETNVVDCNCDEYVHDFEIVQACLDEVARLNSVPKP